MVSSTLLIGVLYASYPQISLVWRLTWKVIAATLPEITRSSNTEYIPPKMVASHYSEMGSGFFYADKVTVISMARQELKMPHIYWSACHAITSQLLMENVMANFKRKRPRNAVTRGRTAEPTLRKRLGITPVIVPRRPEYSAGIKEDQEWRKIYYAHKQYRWSVPAWWDRIFHTRPARARIHQLERLIARGVDPDCVSWPDNRKPHIYYW